MAVTIYPWIFASKEEKQDKVLMNHEQIHIAQQKELLVIGGMLAYIFHGLYLAIKLLNLSRAYDYNLFEVEAKAHEKDLDYLKNRKSFACFKKDDLMEARWRELDNKYYDFSGRAGAVFLIIALALFVIGLSLVIAYSLKFSCL
jgi:hypothetical protein